MKSIFKSRTFQVVFSLLVSVVLVAWVLCKVDIASVVLMIKQVNYWIIIPIVLLTFLQMYVRAIRWRFLLSKKGEEKRPTIKLLFDSLMMGNFGNFVLPLRGGEFVRPLMLARYSSVRYPLGLASVITERFFDLSMVLILFAFMVLFLGDIPTGIIDGVGESYEVIKTGMTYVAGALSLLALALFVFIVAGALWPDSILKLVEKALFFFPEKIRGVFLKITKDFLSGTEPLGNIKNLSLVIVLSMFVWLITIVTYWVAFFMFSSDTNLGMWAALVVTVVLALGVAAPSAPGFMGVFEVSCIVAFALFGESKELATTYAVINHVLQYAIIISYGVYLLFAYGIRLKEFKMK